MKQYACIDIGGTAIKYGLVDENGTILVRKETPTEAQKGGAALLEKACTLAEELKQDAKSEEAGLAGIAISTAGMVDPEKGEIIFAGPAIPQYAGTKFKEVMEERFGVPVEVENDVNCAGLAEATGGAARGRQYVLVLTIGTGIGGCFVKDGQVYHGAGNSACEIGYLPMDGTIFERLGAASALCRRVAELKEEPAEKWDGRAIFNAAKQKDELCEQAIDEMCDVLGKGIATASYILNPDAVVLGGGIMAQEEILRPKIEAALNKYLVPVLLEPMDLYFASHQNNAGMMGAFYNFISKHPAC